MSERTKALLSAAATIYAGYVSRHANWSDEDYANAKLAASSSAYRLLELIEAREKENAPKTVAYCTCDTVHGDNHLCPIHGG